MEKYCFLWQQWACLPSSDWAAWVQAFGSIGAILAAAGIAFHQHRIEVNRRLMDAIEANRQQCVQARHLIVETGDILHPFLRHRFGVQYREMHHAKVRMTDVMELSGAVQVAHFNAEQIKGYLRWRRVAAEFLASIESGALSPKTAKELHDDLQEAVDAFNIQEHPEDHE